VAQTATPITITASSFSALEKLYQRIVDAQEISDIQIVELKKDLNSLGSSIGALRTVFRNLSSAKQESAFGSFAKASPHFAEVSSFSATNDDIYQYMKNYSNSLIPRNDINEAISYADLLTSWSDFLVIKLSSYASKSQAITLSELVRTTVLASFPQ
jgi:hypothetical protein